MKYMMMGRVLLTLRTYLEEPENSKSARNFLQCGNIFVNSMTYEAGEKKTSHFEELKKIADLMDHEVSLKEASTDRKKNSRLYMRF